MKTGNRATVVTLALGLALSFSSYAAPLKIGDPAPKLQVGKWIQGEPVKDFATDQVYVIEFWATWCGPCKILIPHLNELQKQYKGKVTVIGQNVMEPDDSAVEPFVKKMGTNMTYRVALDDKSKDPNGAMLATWMSAADRNGIPTAFIVNQQGRIAWIGYAAEMGSDIWDKILAGHWDLAQAATDYDKSQANQQRAQELNMKLSAALQSDNWDQASAALDEIEKVDPGSAINGEFIRFQILLEQKKYEDAYKLARSLTGAHPEEAELQRALSWQITTRPSLEKRDTAFAEELAERANKTAGGKDWGILNALARAQFMNGKKKEAIATQEKALALAEPGQQSDVTKASLKSYQDDKLPEIGK